ncbi:MULTISPECIES: diguanylate cyclase [unclassified Pseudomonas]|uniref:GGDEF domain-containing protein n=1 Tax=unclassified Pseudomonas TaxID=196821 RepID=UPI000BC4C611|nr:MULTISPECIES: GGDEF domain-containing protein [unclassified Pseudomonas]PVZ12513.1 diguanylate cyclase (GGDEF)-like protein [Pseudomonas sp. URIL14HWK12:I12]PVZ23335.1 diguanylate cyclase (GGDEF)-like protein [Pseudomonas sp. URIL14HWK12:I10]PVZ32665.1 diguanylate cyclase (GGDEF)-like protein [Pseudomonas sp. URIL14HWK12:I11]SNZ13819.1 diguanylate cyclase (GGDEF) domain-containing protein [Pseudomonas sp. URIL14HWK12:I9]
MTDKTLQALLLKRFGLAAGTYVLFLAAAWCAWFAGDLALSLPAALCGTALVVGCQLALLAVFSSQLNWRFSDPSLTQAQVVAAIVSLTGLLAFLGQTRGLFMMLYVVLLLFGLFHLPRRVFVRCAVLEFAGFSAMNLALAWHERLDRPGEALIQTLVLSLALVWICLYASYVQASRQRMRQRRFALQAHQDTLRGMMRQLEDLVATDELTGLFNRRHFLRMASSELAILRPGMCHGLALIDLDHFKRINDVHGHAAGDQVLQVFAEVALTCLREGDVLARYGGEEFVLMLPDSDSERLRLCCERLRQAFQNAAPVGGRITPLSLSAGMTLLEPGDDLDDALQRADKALYQAKREGRNRCCAAWEVADA